MRQTTIWIFLLAWTLFASNVEQAILALPPSAEEMVRRSRTLLLKSLQDGDSALALQTVAFLNERYSENLCPFSRMEKGLVYLQIRQYDSAWTELVRERRLFAPQAKRPNTVADRCALESSNENGGILYFRDELFGYLKRNFTWTGQKMDSLLAHVATSSVPEFYKDAIPAFFPVVFSWELRDDSRASPFFRSAERFVQKYPGDENGIWLRENFLGAEQGENSVRADDAFLSHLYGTSVGFEFLSGMGFLTSDFKKEFRHRYGNFHAALPIQLFRATFTPFVSFGMLETRKNRQFADVLWEKGSDLAILEGGMTLGLVAFDSRFFKVEPFLGIASMELALPDNSADYYYYADKPNNNYHRLRRYVEDNRSVVYLAGVSGEFRLLSIYSRRSEAPISSISLRVKYMAHLLDHDLGFRTLDGVSHQILAGIGFFIW